jgi:hypothetical protein
MPFGVICRLLSLGSRRVLGGSAAGRGWRELVTLTAASAAPPCGGDDDGGQQDGQRNFDCGQIMGRGKHRGGVARHEDDPAGCQDGLAGHH